MRELCLVFVGGGLGSVARLLIAKLYKIWQPDFPLATLTVNVLSCFIFGLVLMLGVQKLNVNYTLKLLIITGFCGGFSTYSAFTFETVELFKSGQNGMAIGNIILNFTLSISGLYLGMALVKVLG